MMHALLMRRVFVALLMAALHLLAPILSCRLASWPVMCPLSVLSAYDLQGHPCICSNTRAALSHRHTRTYCTSSLVESLTTKFKRKVVKEHASTLMVHFVPHGHIHFGGLRRLSRTFRRLRESLLLRGDVPSVVAIVWFRLLFSRIRSQHRYSKGLGSWIQVSSR